MSEVFPKNLNIFLKNSAGLLAIIVYAIGFVAWNYYLSAFGFFEYNFIQLRYFSAGLLICLPIIIFLVLYLLIQQFEKFSPAFLEVPIVLLLYSTSTLWVGVYRYIVVVILLGVLIISWRSEYHKRVVYVVCFLIISWWWYFSIFYLFPVVPQYLGGAKPMPITIIGTGDQIVFLKNFDITSATNAANKPSVQTNSVCLIYQNNDYVLFFVATPFESAGFNIRPISISRNNFIGLQNVISKDASVSCDISDLFRAAHANR